jgi:hypothetical protein
MSELKHRIPFLSGFTLECISYRKANAVRFFPGEWICKRCSMISLPAHLSLSSQPSPALLQLTL